MDKRAAIYVRVSTDKQTIETQLRELRQIAEWRGWEVVHEYHDAGISGAKSREARPRPDQMLKDGKILCTGCCDRARAQLSGSVTSSTDSIKDSARRPMTVTRRSSY
jgi:Resolvase, N terminal domain